MEVKNILAAIGNSAAAVLKGEFLLRLGITRYFGKILYVFFLICLIIWISLMTDNTLGKVEKNKNTIRELQTTEVMKTFELERYRSRSFTGRMLQERGSRLQESENAAIKIGE